MVGEASADGLVFGALLEELDAQAAAESAAGHAIGLAEAVAMAEEAPAEVAEE